MADVSPSPRSAYLENFAGDGTAGARQQEALKTSLDIRKFEIELYWKRGTYFYTMMGAALAGYFLLQKDGAPNQLATYIVSCLGFTFSLAWYFVNRGSKSWQRNWEHQVDLLEDEVMGPLHKSGLNRYETRLIDFAAGYPFSPTNINHILGLYVAVVWLLLIVRTVHSIGWSVAIQSTTVQAFGLLTLATCWAFFRYGQTRESDDPIKVTHRRRQY